LKIYLTIALLDCLNGNVKSAELFITNISKYIKEKPIIEESEKIIFGFVLIVIKNERMKYEETIAEILIKNNKEYLPNYSNYAKIIQNYKLTDCLYCK
jgi:hypothetical protein